MAEAYSLEVATDGIRITGSDAAGVFYGIQSLRSMIPIEAYQKKSTSFSLTHVIAEDAPRFGFRGSSPRCEPELSNEGDHSARA